MSDFLSALTSCFVSIAPYAVIWSMARKVFVYTVNAVTGNHAEF